MPLYEYQCVKCGKKSEFIRNFSDPHETECPWCGGALKKLLSSPAFQFKGSGFYATDYAKSGGSSGKGERNEEKKDSEKKDSSKGEEGKSGASGGGESKDAEAGAGKKEGDSAKGDTDSSKGKKESGGEASPARSKKKDHDRK